MNSEWMERTLADLFEFSSGKSIAPGGDGAFPAYGSNGLIGRSPTSLFSSGIIIGRVGAYCGSVALGAGPFWASDNTIVARPRAGVVDLRFAFYLLLNAKLNSWAGGAAQPLLTQSVLKPLRFPVPSLQVQVRIASLLGAYDDLIEVNRRRIALLEEMARRLFEEWFVHFRFPGHDAEGGSEAAQGSLPSGWRMGTLGDVVEQRRDTTAPGGHLSGRAYVPIECIGRRTLAISETNSWTEAQSSLQLFERGDILFGAMRAYFHKVAPAPRPGVTRSTCFVLRPRSADLFAFASMALFRDQTVAYAATNSKGSTIPYAQWAGSLDRLAIPIPDKETLHRFDGTVRPLIELVWNTCDANRALASARDLILPRLISGELSVAAAERELGAAA